MRTLLFAIVFAVVSPVGFGQNLRPYQPVEPTFMDGGTQRFYQFITDEIDFSKVAEEKTMRVTFYLNTSGIMNDIQASEFKSQEAANEVVRVLSKAHKWDISNQPLSFSRIRYKIKLLFNNKKVLGETQISWDSGTSDRGQDFKQTITDENKQIVENEVPIVPGEDNTIYNTAGIQVKPEFPGGLKAFYTYMGKNYKAPDVKGLTGKVFVSFVVEKDGSLNQIKVLRDVGYGSGEEAVRVLKNSPNWSPAEQNGKKVRVLYMLPISIQPR